jgi:phosphomannomutase
MEGDISMALASGVRHCPGERADIPHAICKGRQIRNYPKCAACEYRAEDMRRQDGALPKESVGVFRAYDIRGTYPAQINEKVAEIVGMATAKFLGAKMLVVGRDMRTSSEPLARAVIEGARGLGCNVVDIGLCSTDAHYFATGQSEASGGIMVTASHNPPNENGFKISREKVMPVGEESGLQNIKAIAMGPRPRPASAPGNVESRDIGPAFTSHVLGFARNIPRMKVVIDAGNGMMGRMLPPILAKLPLDVTPLYFDLDATFPHHEANPLKKETFRDVQALVLKKGADLGVAFDGDGDRCGFVDDRGEVVSGDLITALLAKSVLKRLPGATVIFDVRSSRVVEEEVRKAGGIPCRERVGHAFMKATLRKRNAPFGGELACHYYFRDNFFTDSGALAFIAMLNVLAEEGRPLSVLMAPLRRYHATGEINFDVADKQAKIKDLARAFPDARMDYKDGLTVQYRDWWFNVRPSQTQSLLRLNIEAASEVLMDEKKTLLTKIITS